MTAFRAAQMSNNMQENFYHGILRSLSTFSLIVVLGMLSACKSYQLGSPAEISFDSIYVAPVANHSYAPQAQAIISAMLRENFARDGRVKVVAKKEKADVVLLVDLIDYERSGTARSQQDTAIADSFDLRLEAGTSLLDQKTGTYLFEDRSVQIVTNAYTSNPYEDDPVIAYQLSERQAMEQLARELAQKVTEMVLNPW